MRTRIGLLLGLLGVLVAAPQSASRQSFLYVASPQTACAGPGYPCPPSEVLVFDSDTGGLVTRIPLSRDSTEHALVFAPDGRTLYAFGNRGTTKIDTTTHAPTTLPIAGTPPGVRTGPAVISRDGARIFAAATAPNFSTSLLTVDTTTGATALFSDPQQCCLNFGGMVTSRVANRLFVNSAKPGAAGGLYEYDTVTDQGSLRLTNVRFAFLGPLAISPDGARLYYGAPNSGARRIAVVDTGTFNAIGEFAESAATKIYAGARGGRVYSLAPASDPRVRIFDAVTLNPSPLAEAAVSGATNLVASEDESRLFVGASVTLSSEFSEAEGGIVTYRNRVDVLNAVSAATISSIALPDSSWRYQSSPHPLPDRTMAMATTPPDAPRCSYRAGTTQNAWTIAGGSTTITLTTGCSWVASSDASWVHLSQASGATTTTLTITVDPSANAAARTATITIGGQLVTISQAGHGSTAPFGFFDTPQEAASRISGALAVTGWALDDAGVTGVRIFRDPVAGEAQGAPIFIGHATIVEGARPDVVAAFPTFPLNTRAGWGLNVLTNLLPNQGDGTFRLYAFIDDIDGRTTVLGPRTFTSSNRNATVPFGAIDTPGPGEVVSGTIICFGWALTPQPNVIPTDGSTIEVLIDGVVVGRPSYNHFRSDIATLFPGLQNSSGAVGHFTIDTTQYANGVHTIAWLVRDQAGNAAGIGSRYFTIQN